MATKKTPDTIDEDKAEQAEPATDLAHRIDMNDPGKTVDEAVAENLGS
jgi:hypothetical protein